MFQTDGKKKPLTPFGNRVFVTLGYWGQDSRTWELMEVLEPGSESSLWEDHEANNLGFTGCMDPAAAI